MKKRAFSLLLALALITALLASCAEKEPDYDFTVDMSGIATENVSSGVSVHDPSILKVDGTYYIYGSHMASAKSTDLMHWERMSDGYSPDNPIFGAIYDKADEAFAYTGRTTSVIPAGSDAVWAPDVKYNENLGKYVMYYCTSSTFNASNLCYAFSDTPDGDFEWQGALIYSGFDKGNIQYTDVLDYVTEEYAFSNYVKGNKNNVGEYDYLNWPNAIDPTLFTDADGNDWLVYGSWSGGIFLLEIDETTGKVIHPEADQDNNVDAYFGKKLVGGGHESMEAPYILYDPDSGFYYLFVSYGSLNRDGGYQIRVFRSDKPDGQYVDMNGMNLGSRQNNAQYALKLSGNYNLPSLKLAYKATGHNSAFIDEDGKRYVVYHTRFDLPNSEAHSPRVHQYLLNADGWPCMLPYQTQGETVSPTGYTEDEVAGRYYFINQGTFIGDQVSQPSILYLNKGGKVKTETEEGTWSMEENSYMCIISIGEKTYKGVFCAMKDEAGADVMTFSAVGYNESVWGVKYAETAAE